MQMAEESTWCAVNPFWNIESCRSVQLAQWHDPSRRTSPRVSSCVQASSLHSLPRFFSRTSGSSFGFPQAVLAAPTSCVPAVLTLPALHSEPCKWEGEEEPISGSFPVKLWPDLKPSWTPPSVSVSCKQSFIFEMLTHTRSHPVRTSCLPLLLKFLEVLLLLTGEGLTPGPGAPGGLFRLEYSGGLFRLGLLGPCAPVAFSVSPCWAHARSILLAVAGPCRSNNWENIKDFYFVQVYFIF